MPNLDPVDIVRADMPRQRLGERGKAVIETLRLTSGDRYDVGLSMAFDGERTGERFTTNIVLSRTAAVALARELLMKLPYIELVADEPLMRLMTDAIEKLERDLDGVKAALADRARSTT